MNEKQLAERLRMMVDNCHTLQSFRALADELDPPKPEPGLVTYKGVHDIERHPAWWDGKTLTDCATGTPFHHTALDTLDIKPARILEPRQVAVDVPPVEDWPIGASAVKLVYETEYVGTTYVATVATRSEAERMEASDDC